MGFPNERTNERTAAKSFRIIIPKFLFSKDEDEDELMKMNRRDPKRLLGEKFDLRRNFWAKDFSS